MVSRGLQVAWNIAESPGKDRGEREPGREDSACCAVARRQIGARFRGNVLPLLAGQQRRNCRRVIVSPEPVGSVYGTPPLLIQLSIWPWTTCTLPGV